MSTQGGLDAGVVLIGRAASIAASRADCCGAWLDGADAGAEVQAAKITPVRAKIRKHFFFIIHSSMFFSSPKRTYSHNRLSKKNN
jgi:hypothetical protein